MEGEKSNRCRSCNLAYSDTRRPHVLNCGHSLCTNCINMCITFKNLFCSICSSRFKASSASDISINYSLENCFSVMRRREFGKTLESQHAEKNHDIEKLIEYQKSNAQDLLLSSKDLIEDLKNYHEYLHRNMKEHKEIGVMIQERAKMHKYIGLRMFLERSEVTEAKEKIDAYIKKMESTLPELNNATSNKDVAAAVAGVTEIYDELSSLSDDYQMEYPNPELTSFQRLLMRSMDVLYMEDFNYVKGNTQIHSCPFDDPSISDKLAICNIEDFLTVSNLKSDLDKWKKRISRGLVAATSWCNGRKRIGYIWPNCDRIYLHCLSDGMPRPGKYVIEHKEILTCVKNNPSIVFLALAWDGLLKGQILIKLFPDSPLAQHFKALCTGELGPTYLKKKISQIIHPGPIERIKWEPCQGSNLISNVLRDTLAFNGAVHKHDADEGIIWMDTNFSFYILIGSGQKSKYNNVFGQVQDGISLLKESAERIKKGLGGVEITDTGVCLEI